METFFFISLGITFILILLLVYHFKQRLSSLEQKSDTMFDIINNVVKEMMVIKTMASANQVAIPGLSSFMQTQRPLNEAFSQMQFATEPSSPEVQQIYLDENDDESEESSDVGESHSEDEDEDEDEDGDEGEDGDEDEDGDEGEDEDNEKVIVSDDDDDHGEPVDILSEIETIAEEDVKVIDLVHLQSDPVVINKIEATVEEPEAEETVSPMEEYKKLGTSALKTLVISKGLATDVSKLKKHQLLSLLE
jgi:hypothetical protein